MTKLPLINFAQPVAASASQKRIACYMAGAVASFILGVQQPPHLWWDWVRFFAGLGAACFNVYRAFIDLTEGKQDPAPDAKQDPAPTTTTTPQAASAAFTAPPVAALPPEN